MLQHLSTRSRILWVVIASAAPLILLSLYGALSQRDNAEAHARNELRHHTHLVWVAVHGMHVSKLPLLEGLVLGRGETLEIVDDNRFVIARFPAGQPGVGEEYVDRKVLDQIADRQELMFEQRDFAGRLRLYAFRRAEMYGEREFPVMIFVSIPVRAIYFESNRTLVRSLAGLCVVTLLLIAFAWFGAERLVLRHIRSLLQMTGKVRSGDFAARTGIERSREELSQLGSALDEMAGQLQARDTKLRKALDELRTQAVTDSLTELYNRRYFWDELGRELIAARRKGLVFSLILMDIDYFKNVNDTWGHEAGDLVLKACADLLRSSIRGSDIAVRYGGEEFAMLLPETTAEVAEERVETLRREIEAMEVPYGSAAIRITASFGIAQYDGVTRDAASLMRSVDEALYEAKQSGRNRVIVHRPPPAVRTVDVRH
jgi:diguanylate cyclase (GGDEF)-like protein